MRIQIVKFFVSIFICIFVLPTVWADVTKDVVLKKEGELNPDLTNPGAHLYPDWFKVSFLDLREDVAEAAEANKRVLLFFYQDGCPYCKKLLEVNLAQKTIADKMRATLDVITINMWGDREVTDFDGEVQAEKKFAAKMKVMYTPTLLFLDEQGKVALRVNGYYKPHKFMTALDYVAGKHEHEISFRDYYKKVNPPPAYGKLHEQPFISKPPYDLTSVKHSGAKPLLVLFEQKQCPACDELHTDVFKRKETLRYIKQFDVVQLNMWSKTPVKTPAGKELAASQWASELNIKYAPSLLFFDETGNEVFRAEAYLKSFHLQSVMDYVATKAYKKQPSFQRYIEARGAKLREQGVEINLME